MSISPYEDASESSGVVRIVKDLDQDVGGEDVLVVEDIIDTGLTLSYLLSTLQSRGPRSIEVCTLLDKSARRIAPLQLRYVGFDCPDRFVIGYGLDYQERYRNLESILAVEDFAALAGDPDAAWPFDGERAPGFA
jgi:hypoxanthine phosphoribosyltransferase